MASLDALVSRLRPLQQPSHRRQRDEGHRSRRLPGSDHLEPAKMPGGELRADGALGGTHDTPRTQCPRP